MADTVYIDLFDDGIPLRNPLHGVEGFEGSLLDVVRFQVLLCVLLKRSIVVPETWAVSSPLFLTVAREVLNAWRMQWWKTDGQGKSSLQLARAPIVLHFLPVNHAESPVQAYLNSLQWRLSTGRRLMFSAALAATPTPGGDAARVRAELGQALKKIVDAPQVGQDAIDTVRQTLTSMLEIIDEPIHARTVAASMCCLLEHLRSSTWKDVSLVFDESGFRRHAAVQVEHVRTALASTASSLVGEFETNVLGFQAFFERAGKSGIHFGDIMGLERLLADEQDLVAEPIRAFGRYVLSRAYAASVGADNQSFSMGFHCRRTAPEFASAMLAGVLSLERRPDPLAQAGPAFEDFVRLAPDRDYDLADTLDWARVWDNIVAIASHPDWDKRVDKMKHELYTLPESELRDPARWQDFFDTVNASVQDILFKAEGGERPTLRLLKKMPAVGTLARAGERAGPAAMPLLKAAATLATSGVPGAAIGIAAMDSVLKLLGKSPTKLVLQLERERRRAATLLQ
jgi:hypothetical protein